MSRAPLGNWYANLVHVGRQRFVLAVGERTFLPVVIQAAPISTLVPRLRVAVADVMRGLGLPEHDIAQEDAAMSEVVFAKTASKQVLGVINDLAFALTFYVADGTLREVSLKLGRTLLSPLYKTKEAGSPDRATLALFERGTAVRVVH